MGIFEDMERLLETRLDEFLKAHPSLELRVLEDQLREQEAETQKLLHQLSQDEQKVQANILKTAEEVQRWHGRIAKAEQAQRPDLAQGAREREAALLRQGNQQWAQMALLKQQIQQTQTLQAQIRTRRQELQAKMRHQATQPASTSTTPQAWQSNTWSGSGLQNDPDSLEAKFKAWEVEEELEALKRRMG